ncbi:hypothetical protein [Phaffia rhodozyma]|uniref:Uncharacterized protein n=1 Tax=Phaffia rhodozyma TaxID=264483 RepID=A0A0F7SLP5_PHARH|nr:hypothetical protein [Phaffia rhodozyma]
MSAPSAIAVTDAPAAHLGRPLTSSDTISAGIPDSIVTSQTTTGHVHDATNTATGNNTGKAPIGDKISGEVDKLTGKAQKNPELVAQGVEKKGHADEAEAVRATQNTDTSRAAKETGAGDSTDVKHTNVISPTSAGASHSAVSSVDPTLNNIGKAPIGQKISGEINRLVGKLTGNVEKVAQGTEQKGHAAKAQAARDLNTVDVSKAAKETGASDSKA